MSEIPRLIGYQIIDVTTGEPTRGETEIFTQDAAIHELLRVRRNPSDQWKMVAILEGDLDRDVGESGPIRIIA